MKKKPSTLEPFPLLVDPPQLREPAYQEISPLYVYGPYKHEARFQISADAYLDPSELPGALRQGIEEASRFYDLDWQLKQAEEFAQTILDKYRTEADLLLRQRYVKSLGAIDPEAERYDPPQKIRSLVHYATEVRACLAHLAGMIARGDIRYAALWGYWLGRYVEALRVLKTAHLIERARKQDPQQATAGKQKKSQQKREQWKIQAQELWEADPDLSLFQTAKRLARDAKEVQSIRKYLAAEFPSKKRAR